MNRTAATLAAFAAALLPAIAAAQQLSPKPETGLWEIRSQVLVNGRDMMADMRAAQATMMKKMAPEQRAQFEAMMKEQGGGNPGNDRECIDAKALEAWSDPQARLREMEKEARNCKFQPLTGGGNTLQFKGRCTDPEGFTGDVTGTMTMQGAKAWTAVYSGKGTMAAMEAMGQKSAGGPIEMKVESNGRWLAASCGAVKPR